MDVSVGIIVFHPIETLSARVAYNVLWQAVRHAPRVIMPQSDDIDGYPAVFCQMPRITAYPPAFIRPSVPLGQPIEIPLCPDRVRNDN